LSVKKGWGLMSDKDKENRTNNIKKITRKNSKYGIELIREIKNKFKEGYKVKELKKIYPQFNENYLYSLKNNKRWVDL
jgi:hypothetical protein